MDMQHDKYDEILRLFVQRLRNQLGDHLKHIVLFGSRARGDDLPGSDYDCMAILDHISPSLNDAIDEIAGEFLYEHNALFSIFSVTEKRYREQTYNPLFMNVEKEGISL